MYRRLAALLSLTAAFSLPVAANPVEEFHTRFSGFNEVGGLGAGETGAIVSEGKGTLLLKLDRVNQTLWFQLTYSGLSSPVVQSHIHLGKNHVAGNVMVFFCSNNNVPNVQPCPADGGTVTGTITAASVLAVASQNVSAGDFDALTDALSSNTAYANIHTMKFPAGEIRGQIHRTGDEHHGDEHHGDEHDHD
jgi:hypothetical protein